MHQFERFSGMYVAVCILKKNFKRILAIDWALALNDTEPIRD